jgi:tRNA(Ile)-lysidine synthase
VDHSPDVVQIAAEGLGRSLVVRSRQPGDRIRPTGLGGRKKLQDVLVDRKVRRIDRDRIPVVTDEEGRMVWVAGHVLDEGFKVTDHTKAVIILRLRRIARLRTWSDRDAG